MLGGRPMVTCFCLTRRSVQLRSMFWIFIINISIINIIIIIITFLPSRPWVCRTRLQLFATHADSCSSLKWMDKKLELRLGLELDN